MTPGQHKNQTAEQQELVMRIIKAALFEGAMMLIGLYFVLCFVDPKLVAGFGLSPVFEGVINIVLGVLSFGIGAVPLLRVIGSANSRK